MKVIFFVVLSIFFIAGCDEKNSWPRAEFDRAAWLHSAESERYKWARDIIDTHRLDGLTNKQVTDLLGAPSSRISTGVTYVIKVGGQGFNKIYVLDIRFKENIVEEYYIRGD